MDSDLDPWGSVVILHVIMRANEEKVPILVAPKWGPKWSRKSTNCDKKQREEDSCKKMQKRSNSWPLDRSSEGFPLVREPYFHFYRSVQKMVKKGVQNELFWTTLAPAGLPNAVCFATQKLSISNKQIRGSPPTLRDGRNPPNLGSNNESTSLCGGLYWDLWPKAPFFQNLVF